MKILHDLIYQAGGYSSGDLEKASDTERREILQLGCAVLFSTAASIINWSIASTHLLSNEPSSALITFITFLVVFPISLSINRNLIFSSDTRVEKKQAYDYPSTKESVHTLPYVRIALVAFVCSINIILLKSGSEFLFLIAVLGLFELYPLFVKKQVGQTIMGRRMQEKLLYQHQRSELKGKEYAKLLKRLESDMQDPDDPNDPDQSPSVRSEKQTRKADYDTVRLVK